MAGTPYRFPFPTMPTEHTFKAGHRIGVIVARHRTRAWSRRTGQPINVAVTLDTRTSKVTLPIVGGYEALDAAGAFTDPTGTVGRHRAGDAVADAGRAGELRRVHAGRRAASTRRRRTATVISTAGDATLSVADPSTNATGHLVNGAFALTAPLQGLGVVKTWAAPTSNEVVPVTFKQAIAANEPLRTGTYSKTLTFTLSTTTP